MVMEKTEEAGKRASQLVADYLASRYHTLRIIKESPHGTISLVEDTMADQSHGRPIFVKKSLQAMGLPYKELQDIGCEVQGILHGRTAACRHDHCHRRIHCRRTAVQPARAKALPDASRGHSPDLDLMQRPDTPAPARHPPSRHQAIEHHGAARRELERPLPAHRLRCRADRQRRARRRHAAARHKRLCAAGAVWQRPDRCAQ